MKKTRLHHSRTFFQFSFYSTERNLVIVMLAVLLFTVSSFHAQAIDTVIQVSIEKQSVPVKEVLQEMKKQSKMRFFYNDRQVDVRRIVSVHFQNVPLPEALQELFKDTSIRFKFSGQQILLYEAGNLSDPTAAEEATNPVATETSAAFGITGRVVDDAGQPLPGVNILEKNTTNGTTTDADGTYKINVADGNAVLVFSFIGYVSQEVGVNNRTVLDISLAPDVQSLSEVVVVGYGSQRRADITSAVSVVNMNNIGNVPASNASRLLVGQAAGVQVRQTQGRPGSELEVTVRGIGSLGAGSQPLYVVDGFPIGTSMGQSLNPADIASISVLKDAASTAIYGARGSNGVILITTKSAKEGQVNLTFDATYGVQNIPASRKTKMMNGVEFAQFKKDSFMDKIRYFEGREPLLSEVPAEFQNPGQTKYSTNWFDEISNQNAKFQNYNVTLSAGKGNIRSLVSVGYLNQEGAVIKTGFKRYNVRANLDGKINDFISIGWNIVGSNSNEKYANTDGRDALIGRALWTDPRYPVYKDDGTFNTYIGGTGGVFGAVNPVQELHEMDRNLDQTNVLTNGYLQFTFLKNFKFKSSVNATLINSNQKEFRPSTLAGTGFNQPPPRDASQYERYFNSLNTAADQLLSYSTKIKYHSFDGLLGFSAQEQTDKALEATGSKYPDDIVRFLDVAATKNVGSSETSWSLLAYFGKVNYAFKDKYLFSASYRREGSSRFGANNKWGDFPAASVGWRITEESFMPHFSWLTDMKLRASYGITGNNNIGTTNNNNIGNYPSLASMSASNYILGNSLVNGKIVSSFANAELGWEQSKQVDVGMDLALFDNKVTLTAEFYERTTDNMLLSVEIPAIAGFNNTFSNIGKVQNKGLELALDYRGKAGPVNFRSNFNISFNRNEVLAIRGGNDEIWNGGFYSTYNVSKVGRPIGMLYGYRMIGIFNTDAEVAASPKQDGAIPGVYKYFDADGNGVISYDQKDMVEIGNPYPDYIWALTLGADYKKFDINVLLTGAQNYNVFRNIEATTMNMDGVFNILQSGVNRWRSAENPGDGRGATSNTWKWERESNSRYVYDASHVWVKNVSIGYTLPKTSKLSHARLFISAENMFLITRFPGSNPEINQRGGVNPGVDDEAYPVPRTFTMGASIRF
jgi:TonB-dependent starch-binding outer membrane protein SusC